jgi:hypothetical protein
LPQKQNERRARRDRAIGKDFLRDTILLGEALLGIADASEEKAREPVIVGQAEEEKASVFEFVEESGQAIAAAEHADAELEQVLVREHIGKRRRHKPSEEVVD